MLRRAGGPLLLAVSPKSHYVPYSWMLNRLAEHGCASRATTAALLAHPEAPPPWIVLRDLSSMVVPDKDTVIDVMEATARAATKDLLASRSIADGRAPRETATVYDPELVNQPGLLMRVSPAQGILIIRRIALSHAALQTDHEVLNTLCIALAMCQHHTDSATLFMQIPSRHVQQRTWRVMVKLASRGVIDDPTILRRIVSLDEFPLCWQLDGADAAAIMARGWRPVLIAYHVLLKHLAPTILKSVGLPVPRQGANVRTKASAEVKVAIAALHRWDAELRGTVAPQSHRPTDIRATDAWKRAMRQSSYLSAGGVNNAVPEPDLIAFEVFFTKVREAHAGSRDLALNWRLPWRMFQLLNRCNPTWTQQHPESVGRIIDLLLATLAMSTNPWHALNLAHFASSRGLVDGVEAALVVLHHAHRGQFGAETLAISKNIFQWLLGPAAIHKHPARRSQVVAACRVFIKLEMYAELEQLYDAAVQHTAAVTDEASDRLRGQLVSLMKDLLCPDCSSVLQSKDAFVDRQCQTCGAAVPKLSSSAAPSFEVNPKAQQRSIEQRLQRKKAARSDLMARITAAKQRPQNTVARSFPPATNPKDPTALFREKVLASDSSIPGLQQAPGEPAAVAPFERGVAIAVPSAIADLSAGSVALAVPTKMKPRSAAAADRAFLPPSRSGPWVCCWCRSENATSSLECGSCGATTGPDAEWRAFRSGSRDVLTELQFRVKAINAAEVERGNLGNASHRDVLADNAMNIGYLALLYRRTIYLRARSASGDYVAIETLVNLLCKHDEKVLAGYLYFNLLPPTLRGLSRSTLLALVRVFGRSREVTPQQIDELLVDPQANEEQLKELVVGRDTCGACFGSHSITVCPIVTRNFTATARPQGARSRRARCDAQELKRLIAAITKDAPESLYPAYAGFLQLSDREVFARDHAADVNYLTVMLSSLFYHRRAAFAVCHIPLHLRSTEALYSVCRGFGVEEDDARHILENRKYGDAKAQHPNFVQLTKTCCMCFHDQHASHACPMLLRWFYLAVQDVNPELARSFAFDLPKAPEYELGSSEAKDFAQWSPLAIATWSSTGPERLQAFSKFLISRISTIASSCEKSEHLRLAVNMCISKLAATGSTHQAFRLYAWTPMNMLHKTTTATLLKVRGFGADIISQGLESSTPTGSDWHLMALPPDACLLCFRSGHTLHTCPELQFLSMSQRWCQIATLVSGFCVSNSGVLASAQSLLYDYRCGVLSTLRLRENLELREAVTRLIGRCFKAKLPRLGAMLLRILPVEDQTVPLHLQLWSAAGKSSASIENDVKEVTRTLHQLRAATTPRLPAGDSATATAGAPTAVAGEGHKSSRSLLDLQSEYRRAAFGSLCSRCFGADHDSLDCPLHMSELDFGRDLIAAFRIPIVDEQNFDPMTAYNLELELARFCAKHHKQLPYHIVTVTRAVNAIAAILALMDNVPAALRLLLYIPACYRAEHVFFHILTRFEVPTAKVEKLLDNVFPVVVNADGSTRRRGVDLESTSTVLRQAPIADRAVQDVFSCIPNLDDVLQAGEHQLASTDITDPTQPSTVEPKQFATIEDLADALLPTIVKIEQRTSMAIGSRLISPESVEQLPALPLDVPDE